MGNKSPKEEREAMLNGLKAITLFAFLTVPLCILQAASVPFFNADSSPCLKLNDIHIPPVFKAGDLKTYDPPIGPVQLSKKKRRWPVYADTGGLIILPEPMVLVFLVVGFALRVGVKSGPTDKYLHKT